MEHATPLQHVDTPDGGRYEWPIDGDTALLEYARRGDVAHLDHTYVPPRHEGKGYGARLVGAALADLEARGLQIVPGCSFVAAYIRRHPEWERIVAQQAPKATER